MISIINIVCKQIKEGIVYRVVDDNNNTIELEESDIGEWVFLPRFLEKNKEQYQFFIGVFANARIGQLITGYEEILQEEELRLEIKNTKYEHTKKIGIILRPNLRFAVRTVYENEMYLNINQIDQVLETKKNFIYEKDYRSQCITVYVTLSAYETVD